MPAFINGARLTLGFPDLIGGRQYPTHASSAKGIQASASEFIKWSDNAVWRSLLNHAVFYLKLEKGSVCCRPIAGQRRPPARHWERDAVCMILGRVHALAAFLCVGVLVLAADSAKA